MSCQLHCQRVLMTAYMWYESYESLGDSELDKLYNQLSITASFIFHLAWKLESRGVNGNFAFNFYSCHCFE